MVPKICIMWKKWKWEHVETKDVLEYTEDRRTTKEGKKTFLLVFLLVIFVTLNAIQFYLLSTFFSDLMERNENCHNVALKYAFVDGAQAVLVKLILDEKFRYKNSSKPEQGSLVQEYFSESWHKDISHDVHTVQHGSDSESETTKHKVKDLSVEILTSGLYRITSVITIKTTKNSDKFEHTLYKRREDTETVLMKKSSSFHRDYMSFVPSVLSDVIRLQKEDRISLDVSDTDNVYPMSHANPFLLQLL